jgi:hypothetical protein
MFNVTKQPVLNFLSLCKISFPAERVYNFMKELMVSGCRSPMKLPPGLSAVETELSQVTGQFLRLVSHNRSVFGLYYADIISVMLRRQKDEFEAETQTTASD